MLLKLVKGELFRLNKYNVILVSLLVVIVWSIMLYLIEDPVIFSSLISIIILLDVTMMTVLYTGSVLNFEKTESTMPSLMVTPASEKQLIFSKVISSMIHQTTSTLLVVIAFMLIRGIEINLFILTPIILINVATFTLYGFVFAFLSKDFTSLLANLSTVYILLMLPSLLIYFGVFQSTEMINLILLLSPMEQALVLINSVVNSDYSIYFILSLSMMLIYFLLTYNLIVKKQFNKYVQKGSGV